MPKFYLHFSYIYLVCHQAWPISSGTKQSIISQNLLNSTLNLPDPWICLLPLNPKTQSPSSVNVPVLSSTITLTLPLTLTLGGDMQKIPFFLNLIRENVVPIVIAAGRVGGTAIVTRSPVFCTISTASKPKSRSGLIEMAHPITARPRKIAMYRRESLQKEKRLGLGNKISLISPPLVVWKPVLITTPYASMFPYFLA